MFCFQSPNGGSMAQRAQNNEFENIGNIIIWVRYFLKYILSLILNVLIPLSSGFYYCVATKQMNSNKHYITLQHFVFLVISIPIKVYQTCP